MPRMSASTRLAADDDTDVGINEDAYDVTRVRQAPSSDLPAPHSFMPSAGASSSSAAAEPPPAWLAQWKSEKAKASKHTGVCVTWHSDRGYGFIKRDDGGPDIYVHQREIIKKGFRSLALDERVEFDVSAMDDGRLNAIAVTGPDGADVIGQKFVSKRARGDDDEDDLLLNPKQNSTTNDAAKKDGEADKAKKQKAAMAFVPRAVVRKKPAAGAAAASSKK